MFRLLIPCLIWLSTVRSETGMQMGMPGEPLMEKMSDVSKAKRDSIHQPCESIYPHVPAYTPPHFPAYTSPHVSAYTSPHVPAYAPSSVYVKPFVQQAYLKKELGIAQPLSHLQYFQQTPAYTGVVPKPAVTYVKPVVPALNYQSVHQSVQYIKPVMPIYQKPMLSYSPIYQKPLYYAPMYEKPVYHTHDVMPKVFFKKYEAPVSPFVYQKPLLHAPLQYAAPKVVQVQAPQVSYVKPVIHAQPSIYGPQPVHNSVIVKPVDCV